MYKSIIRPVLFRFSPESIHHFTFNFIAALHRLPGVRSILKKWFVIKDNRLNRTVFGLDFENPVGLAAGFDKDGKLFEELASFGFGFIEVGTVTPKPQPGNPQPRLFRLPSDKALINRMGFNNEGVDALVKRLRNRSDHSLVIGGNIGKNKDTPNENALEDYLYCFDKLFDHVDYFVVNVSSPNTPNLRDLQDKKPLTHILKSLQEENAQTHSPKPILLKIAPDLTNAQLDDIIDIVRITRIHGVIAANTTINRQGLNTPTNIVESAGMGGLSGKPVKARSTEVVRYLHTKSQGRFPIIAVGGIYTAADAREKIEAGASLVQVYTGFIYEGPGMVKKINKGLLKTE
ncbi:MAG: quinone-dependent dihydroorotate dehydrogenase [Owenweeksia sp.]